MKKLLFLVCTLSVSWAAIDAMTDFSKVDLINNTDLFFDINIEQTCCGEPLSLAPTPQSARYSEFGWRNKFASNTINPHSKQTLYEINRGPMTAIHNGKTYTLSTKLSTWIGGSYIGIHQKLKGTWLGSDMWNSLGGTNLSESLRDTDKTGKRQTIWHLPDGKDICVTYDRWLEIWRPVDQLSITLDYAPCK